MYRITVHVGAAAVKPARKQKRRAKCGERRARMKGNWRLPSGSPLSTLRSPLFLALRTPPSTLRFFPSVCHGLLGSHAIVRRRFARHDPATCTALLASKRWHTSALHANTLAPPMLSVPPARKTLAKSVARSRSRENIGAAGVVSPQEKHWRSQWHASEDSATQPVQKTA